MELLIPGLILVALMVYASTRIKKTAAAAFDPETIETDEYLVEKPEGFLNVIGGDPKYAIHAYSKEFGGAGAEDIRQGMANLYIRSGVSMEKAFSEILGPDASKLSDDSEVIDGVKYRVIETKRALKGVDLLVSYKLVERKGKVFIFEGARLAETTPEFARKIDGMLSSFVVK